MLPEDKRDDFIAEEQKTLAKRGREESDKLLVERRLQNITVVREKKPGLSKDTGISLVHYPGAKSAELAASADENGAASDAEAIDSAMNQAKVQQQSGKPVANKTLDDGAMKAADNKVGEPGEGDIAKQDTKIAEKSPEDRSDN